MMTQQPNFFAGACTHAHAKQLFRHYALQTHEDQGGTQAAFLALQTAYHEHCNSLDLWERHCEVLALSLAHDYYAQKTTLQKINDTMNTFTGTLHGVRSVVESVQPLIVPATKLGALLYDIFHDPHEPNPEAKAD
jgi:hypothetical protein